MNVSSIKKLKLKGRKKTRSSNIILCRSKKKFGFNRIGAINSINSARKKGKKGKNMSYFGADIGIGIGINEDTNKTKTFLENISDFITKNSPIKNTDVDYPNTIKDTIDTSGPEYDDVLSSVFTRDPIMNIPYHTTEIKTALVIIGPQNMYLKSDQTQELFIKMIDMLELAGDRITNIYNMLFSNDIVERNVKVYSGINFLVPDLLTNQEQSWSKIMHKEPSYIMLDDHNINAIKKGPIIDKIFTEILSHDKIIIVSFLEPEQESFIQALMSRIDSPYRKLSFSKVPKIIVLKDLDTDLIQQGLDPRIKTVSVSRALYDDYWTSAIVKSRIRRNWSDPVESIRYADPDITEYNSREARSVINKRSRLHNGPAFSFKDNMPVNPTKKEYMFSGRGSLSYFGPNFDTYVILTRTNNYDSKGNPVLEILVKTGKDQSQNYDLIHYMDSIDIILNYLYKKLNLELRQDSAKLLFEGQLPEDRRNTKNAWVEVAVYSWNLTQSHKEIRLDRINYEWIPLYNIEKLINFDGRIEILDAIKTKL